MPLEPEQPGHPSRAMGTRPIGNRPVAFVENAALLSDLSPEETQTQASLSRNDLIKVLTLYDVTESLGFALAQLRHSIDCTPDLPVFLLLGPYFGQQRG